MMNPRIDCSQSPLAVRLKPSEVVALDLQDSKRREGWAQLTQRTMRLMQELGKNNQLYDCGGGVKSFAIDPYGRLSICILSHFDSYDLQSGNFDRGWSDFLARVRGKKRSRPTKCVSCGLKAMCGMCPANGELENRDAEEPVDFLCHVAHLRAHALGLEVPDHGACEYCRDGENYPDLMESLRLLEATDPQLWSQQESINLPVLSAPDTVPGGTSCQCGGGH